MIIFVALALLAGAAAAYSLASFTTTSKTSIVASVVGPADWLHLYSQSTDPTGATTYARSRLINNGVGNYMATGQDAGLTVSLGEFPDADRNYGYQAVFALVAQAQFPDASVKQITVSLTLVPDASGAVILNKYAMDVWGRNGTTKQSVTLSPGQRYQLNTEVRSLKAYTLGATYRPHLVVDVAVPGYPSGVLQYVVPFTFVDAGGS
jgi:FtsP/CotA-like multicopper oxidase with cupredoxin domain